MKPSGTTSIALSLAILVAATGSLYPSVVFADEAQMNRLNEMGFEDFKAGRYAAAARLFRSAYEAFPDPNLRKNEAVAWFKAGKCDEAVAAANAFLIAPDTGESDRLEARSIIANCKVEMARDAVRSDSWTLAKQLLDEASSLEPDQYARDQIAIARVELAAKRKEEVSRPNPAGWVLVGTGAAVLGGTMVYWLLTIPDRKNSEMLSPSDPEFDATIKRARTSRWLVPAAFAGGAALTGVGIYLVLQGGKTSDDSRDSTALLGVTYRW